MNKRLYVVVVVSATYFLVVVSAQTTTTVDPISLGGVQNSPGLFIVIRPSGINALAQTLGKLIDTELPKVTLQKADIPLPLVSNGIYSVQQIKITSYNPARQHSLIVLPNDRLNWVSRGFSFTSNGTFAARILQLLNVPQSAAGTVGIKATDATINLTLVMNPGSSGQPVITVENCTASTSSATLDMQIAGVFGQLLDFLKKKPQSQDSGPLVNNIICDTATYFAESVVNEMLRLSPTNSTIIKDTSLKQNGIPDLATGDLVFNYGLKDARSLKVSKSPSSQETTGFVLDTVGEFSWKNQGGTGFNPPIVDVTSPSSAQSQLDIFITDYVPNSLLYHAYTHKMLDFVVNDKNVSLKQHFAVTCFKNPADPCIGAYLTELTKKYGGQTVQMQSTASSAPYVIFSPDSKNWLINSFIIDFSGKTSGKSETFLSMSVDARSQLTIIVNNNGTISGQLSIKNLTAKVRQNLLADNAIIVTNNATAFVRTFLEKIINNRLSRGYQLSGDQVFLPLSHQPTIKYGQRFAVISSSLNIDQSKLVKLAGSALANVGSKT